MTLNLTFWTIAWCLMGITFVTSMAAILLGARGLDKNNAYPDEPE